MAHLESPKAAFCLPVLTEHVDAFAERGGIISDALKQVNQGSEDAADHRLLAILAGRVTNIIVLRIDSEISSSLAQVEIDVDRCRNRNGFLVEVTGLIFPGTQRIKRSLLQQRWP